MFTSLRSRYVALQHIETCKQYEKETAMEMGREYRAPDEYFKFHKEA